MQLPDDSLSPRLPKDCNLGHAYFDKDCSACRQLLDEIREDISETFIGRLKEVTDELEKHNRKMEAAAIASEVGGGCLNCELYRDSARYVIPILANLGHYIEWMEKQGPVVLPEPLGGVIKAFEEYCRHFEVPDISDVQKIKAPQKRETEED